MIENLVVEPRELYHHMTSMMLGSICLSKKNFHYSNNHVVNYSTDRATGTVSSYDKYDAR